MLKRLTEKVKSFCVFCGAEVYRRPAAYAGLAAVYGAACAGVVDKPVVEQAICAIYLAQWMRG